MTASVLEEVEAAVRAVPDPEIPVITLDDLGVIRFVEADEDAGVVRVVMTPTYSGCPAMEAMAQCVRAAIARHGLLPQVDITFDPPWTTDWMSEAGRKRLQEFGIAPPGPTRGGPVGVSIGRRTVSCPVCGSSNSQLVSEFGSTACKALRRCLDCKEPYEEFKPL